MDDKNNITPAPARAKERLYNWSITIGQDKTGSLPTSNHVQNFFEQYGKSWVFQLEQGELNQNEHFQCFLSLEKKRTKEALLKLFDRFEGIKTRVGIHAERCNDKASLIAYCSKEKGRIGKIYYSDDIILPQCYDALDLLMVKQSPFPVQKFLLNLLDAPPDDRTIYWIYNPDGNIGKSKLVKYLDFYRPDDVMCIDFSTADRLKEALCLIEPRKIYCVDMPKTMPSCNQMADLIHTLEHIKNGHLKSFMYGKFKKRMFYSPHIIVFSNTVPPTGCYTKNRLKTYFVADREEEPIVMEPSQIWSIHEKNRIDKMIRNARDAALMRKLEEAEYAKLADRA